MTAPIASKLPCLKAPFIFLLATFCAFYSWQLPAALAQLAPSRQQIAFSSNEVVGQIVPNLARSENDTSSSLPGALDALLGAIGVMQEKYFDISSGTWPESIDWTAAVLGTHISATLSTLISSTDPVTSTCSKILAWNNLINRYFSHTSVFYFGENALSIRQQAYDDMLWVVLGWLENIKFINLYSSMRSNQADIDPALQQPWHGMQFKPAAAHRARVFYNIAARGWDTSLCNGGMVWNQHLRPYKNSITNELFISASISMYLYFPGDDNDSPFFTTTSRQQTPESEAPHNPTYLQNAIKAYAWLKSSNMTNPTHPGLYADGYHISGWHRTPDGRINPGTGKCDDLNTMVYTYNQGVVLTGLRGLYLATGERSYLADGHALIESVLAATGWPDTDNMAWSGLGRGGVLEEYCDSSGSCSQNGQTFKGIFFGHLAEFCRDLSAVEEGIVSDINDADQSMHGYGSSAGSDQTWQHHLYRCTRYHEWVEHNAHAAAMTRDEEGRFGMWWGRAYPHDSTTIEDLGIKSSPLPAGALDYANDDGALAAERSDVSGLAAPNVRKAVAGDGGASERRDLNDRGRGRTVETQSGGVAVLRALWQWEGVHVKTEEKEDMESEAEL
ncbi:hypothetical protein GJ744_000829 [Endocarpon pusillum]|uniref:Glycosyl hydrolase n=1 Tax=Endocarpon pusillum TaxID=364733 RepID=A0A8H7ANY7_9EURO|nr:hypothetical protein GJ744_000829 [Endocarpon pusillum]